MNGYGKVRLFLWNDVVMIDITGIRIPEDLIKMACWGCLALDIPDAMVSP